VDLGKLVITLDKEEFRIKLEQINRLVEKNDYKGAMEVVDSIDWRRVKNVRTLCVVGEIYAANKRYEDSKEIFLLAYHRAPIGKNILYRLIEVSLKTGNVEEAMEYYEE
jgi:tetratricopeptide (TPR) repeat protein